MGRVGRIMFGAEHRGPVGGVAVCRPWISAWSRFRHPNRDPLDAYVFMWTNGPAAYPDGSPHDLGKADPGAGYALVAKLLSTARPSHSPAELNERTNVSDIMK